MSHKNEAVEAAARALFVVQHRVDVGCFDKQPYKALADACIREAQAALTAAAPIIRAQAKAKCDTLIHDLAAAWEAATSAVNLDTDATIGEWQTAFDATVTKYHAHGYTSGGKDAEAAIRADERRRVADEIREALHDTEVNPYNSSAHKGQCIDFQHGLKEAAQIAERGGE